MWSKVVLATPIWTRGQNAWWLAHLLIISHSSGFFCSPWMSPKRKGALPFWRICTPLVGFHLFSGRILSALFQLMHITSFTNWYARGEAFHFSRPGPCKWLPLAFLSPLAGLGQQGGWLCPPGKHSQTLDPGMQPENRQVFGYLWR